MRITKIKSSEAYKQSRTPITSAEQDLNSEYIEELMEAVDKEIHEYMNADSTFSISDKSIDIVSEIVGRVFDISIPIEDLAWDMDKDLEYVVDGIIDGIL